MGINLEKNDTYLKQNCIQFQKKSIKQRQHLKFFSTVFTVGTIIKFAIH